MFLVLALSLIFLLILENHMSSLNARLKIVEKKVDEIIGVTEGKVNELIATGVKPVQHRVEEIASFTGVDEDKPAPPQVQ